MPYVKYSEQTGKIAEVSRRKPKKKEDYIFMEPDDPRLTADREVHTPLPTLAEIVQRLEACESALKKK